MTILVTQCPYEAQVTIPGGFDYGDTEIQWCEVPTKREAHEVIS